MPQAVIRDAGDRLLAPPELHQLFLVSSPWGAEIADAADELTFQMDSYCRQACFGRPIPPHWFVHIIAAFAPCAIKALRDPPRRTRTGRWGSLATNACTITRDALDVFGWTPDRPSVLVVHGDRKHLHVHVVASVPLIGAPLDWNILRTSRRTLNSVAKDCASAFEIPTGRVPISALKSWAQL